MRQVGECVSAQAMAAVWRLVESDLMLSFSSSSPLK